VNVLPEEHAMNEAFPNRHSNLDPGSSEVNSNVASVASVVPLGPLVMVVCGGERSTFHENVAGSEWLPASSVCRTRNTWVPASTVTACGESQ
jgi:hypothetical protein